MIITNFIAEPISLITKDGRQLTKLRFTADTTGHVLLRIIDKASEKILVTEEIPVSAGEYRTELLLPCRSEDTDARWELRTLSGEPLFSMDFLWKKPREWTIHVMISSHTDIGLHNSHYVQRYNTEKFLDEAAALCDDNENYRYMLEGTWVWNNYNVDRSAEECENIRKNYIKTGKIGICAGMAGNHTNVYGWEEMARSIYGKDRLIKEHGLYTETLTMVDNNGLSWGIVAPYAEAGIKNILFSPNQWNPIP
ncbi:MAG: hypothetical protein J6L72_06020, partial [Butyricicoccus sp.]|nr:hypothetical protein [Butyricicoccus sp.]